MEREESHVALKCPKFNHYVVYEVLGSILTAHRGYATSERIEQTRGTEQGANPP